MHRLYRNPNLPKLFRAGVFQRIIELRDQLEILNKKNIVISTLNIKKSNTMKIKQYEISTKLFENSKERILKLRVLKKENYMAIILRVTVRHIQKSCNKPSTDSPQVT